MFNCPVHDLPVRLDDRRLLSLHSTSAGRLAYYRCLCDGIVLACAPFNGEVIVHTAGPDHTLAASSVGHRACA